MPNFRVRVVASYPPTELAPAPGLPAGHSEDVQHRVWRLLDDPPSELSGIHEGSVDGGTMTDPSLLVLTVVYDVDAPTELDARFDALALFRELTTARELPTAETVLAHVDE